MDSRKIVVEAISNLDTRNFNPNFEISHSYRECFYRPLRSTSTMPLNDVGEKGSALIKKLFEIEGVNCVKIEPYLLQIEKGVAFDWQKIEPKVVDMIVEIFGEVSEVVSK